MIQYLLNKGGISFLFRIFGTGLGFLVMWSVIHLYTNEVYGGFVIIQTVLQLLVVILTLGLQNIIIIEINKNNEDPEHHTKIVRKVIKIIFLFSIVPILGLFFFSEFISTFVFHKLYLSTSIKYLGIGLIIFLIHDVLIYFFIAKKMFIHFGLFMFVIPNVLFLFFLIVNKNNDIQLDHIVRYYIYAFALTLLAELIIIFHKNLSLTPTQLKSKEVLKQSLPMMLSGAIVFLLSWTDVLMLGSMKSEASVGIYNAAFKVGFLVIIVIVSLNVVIAPKISEMYQNDDLDSLKKFVHTTTRLIIGVSLPIVLTIIIFRNPILQIFGEEFSEGSMVLVIITLATFVNAASGNVDQILNLTGNQKELFKLNMIALLLNVVLNYILIPKYGINGAAVASFISTVFINLGGVILVKKRLGFITLY